MTPASCTFVRGDFHFTVTVDRGQESVRVAQHGRTIAHARFETFSQAYLRSRRYAQEFYRATSKPVGRVGEVLIGPDAGAELQRIIESLSGREGAVSSAKRNTEVQ